MGSAVGTACGPGDQGPAYAVVRPIQRPPQPVVRCDEASREFETEFQAEIEELSQAIAHLRRIISENSAETKDLDEAVRNHRERTCEFARRQIETLEKRMSEIDSFRHALWNKKTLLRHAEVMREAKQRLGDPVPMQEIEGADAGNRDANGIYAAPGGEK